MGGRRSRKPFDVSKNIRLDLFFAQVEKDRRRMIVNNVEQLTFETLKQRSVPALRLNKLMD